MGNSDRVRVSVSVNESKEKPNTRRSMGRSSLLLSSLELSDTKVFEPSIRALLGTAAHFCEVVVLTSTLNFQPQTPHQAIDGAWENVARNGLTGKMQIAHTREIVQVLSPYRPES